MTIRFVIRYFHPFVGGLEKRVLATAAALCRQGVPVEVVTGRFSRAWPRRERINGVPVVRLPSPRVKVAGALVYLFCLARHLAVRRHETRVIHAFQVGYSTALAVCTGRLLRIPTVVSLSGGGRSGDVARHFRTPWGRCFLHMCQRADRLVVLSRAMVRELEAIGVDVSAIERIPNGVDADRFRAVSRRPAAETGRETTILYLGRLSREKGIDVLIRAVAFIAARPGLRLQIAGTGRHGPALRRLVRRLGLEGVAEFLEPVERVEDLLQEADVFVMPSRGEGMSNAMLEAMASALPVIASRVAGNVALVQDRVTGLLFTPDCAEELARALEQVIDDPAAAARMGLRARERVTRKFVFADVPRRYRALYGQLRPDGDMSPTSVDRQDP